MYYFLFSQFLFSFISTRAASAGIRSDAAYPFLVKIEAKGKIPVCAGTILTPCVVLTSAHCVEGVEPSEVTVTHITKSIKKYHVAATVIHPQYNSTVLANDIAILQVKENFDKNYAAVKLNDLDIEKVFLQCNSIEILGWSDEITKTDKSLIPEKPMRASVKLISNENCTDVIKNLGGISQGEEKLCGMTYEEGEEERCFTGPGGPVLCSVNSKTARLVSESINSIPEQNYLSEKKETLAPPIDLLENLSNSEEKKFKRAIKGGKKNLQVGVVSWGKTCSNVPSVYVRTDFYYDWIRATSREITNKCYYDLGSFTFLNPLNNEGRTFSCSTVFNFVISFMLNTVLLRFS